MTYRDLQTWSYNDDLHPEMAEQKAKPGEAKPEIVIAGIGIAAWFLVMIALWP